MNMQEMRNALSVPVEWSVRQIARPNEVLAAWAASLVVVVLVC